MKKFLKKSALCSASCLQAAAVIGAGTVGAALISAPAYAQDYTSAAISGTVVDENGTPVQGATVTVTSREQGITRTSTTTATGGFRYTGLPAGTYDVTVNATGKDAYTASGVNVLGSQTADLTIPLSATGNEIIVTGAQIVADFSGTTTGINVDVADLVTRTPIGRSLTDVVLLAPSTSEGDDAFGNLASVGGSSVAENAYYINGLNITNFDNYLGSARVPFEFFKSVEVKSGGYQAEYGRATGGLVNAVSKSGSNDFTAAIHLNYEPSWLQSTGKDLINCSYSDPTDYDSPVVCDELTNRSSDYDQSYSAIVEAGGPIIKDRLFVYGLAEFRDVEWRRVDRAAGTAYTYEENEPFWAVKVDAYPLEDHHLEFTIFDSRNFRTRKDLPYGEADGEAVIGDAAENITGYNYGGVNFVGKYTGNLTEWLTISAAYGRMRDRFDYGGLVAAAAVPYVFNDSGAEINGVANQGYFTAQRNTSTVTPYETERKFYRADADLYFSLFGDHHVRFGFDLEKNTLNEFAVRNGGAFALANNYITSEVFNAGSGGGGVGYYIQAGGEVEVDYFNSGGSFKAENKAFYIQDEWDVTDRLTLSLGLRRDDFKVLRPDGASFTTLKENYAPRLGASYQLWDDMSGKAYAFYGTYYLPFASNTAFRMIGSETYFTERWEYDGFDSNGIPILTNQVTDDAGFSNVCPFGLTPTSSGQNCSVTGDGDVPPSDTLISSNLKATKQTEWIFGYEQNFGGFKVGISYTHRELNKTAEDTAIDAAVIAYCEAEGIAGCSSTWTGFHQYTIINPGSDVQVVLDGLDGREVLLTADQLGLPPAKRTYDGVEITFDRPWDGKWSLGGSYLWSKAKGNVEGAVQSDYEQDDSGILVDYDQPGFVDNSYGYLPNDRRHRFKLFGAYSPLEDFVIGTNISVASPRPLSCFGFYPATDLLSFFPNFYGDPLTRYCGGEASPRGTAQETDWLTTIDLSLRYGLDIPTGQKVTFRADVFNIFNSQAITGRSEFGDLDYENVGYVVTDFIADPNYGVPTSYQTPRYVRLGVDIEF